MILAEVSRHVIESHLTQLTRIEYALNDVTSNICLAL